MYEVARRQSWRAPNGWRCYKSASDRTTAEWGIDHSALLTGGSGDAGQIRTVSEAIHAVGDLEPANGLR